MNGILPAMLIVITLVVLAVMALFLSIIGLWVRALTSGVPIHVLHIVGMKLRGNPARLLIDAYILLSKAGVQTTLDETEYVFMQNRNRVRIPEELVRLVKDDRLKK